MEKGYHPQLEETEVGVGKLQRKHPQRRIRRAAGQQLIIVRAERHVLHSTAQEAHERFAVADTNSGTGILDSCLQKNRKEKYLGGILYAHAVVRKWFSVGLTDDSQCEAPTCFYGPKSGENPIFLVLMQGCSEGTNELMDEPWLLVAKSVMKDLLLSFQHVKCEMKGSNMEELMPTLVACFGKILFHGLVLFISLIKLVILGILVVFCALVKTNTIVSF
ncbi:hypothetical protein R3W88_011968 [Solanum pinnatisectum]|uniref:DUF7903 domain-containing protein n=1 Tax=Solanum pinnatisectum TaxID=50273 RepID=A0AAV9L7L8_9SOLN|nr:hypothetical protein R3W88_011968 [Solanum pinnatisectum]